MRMNTETILRQLINDTNGRIFTATFRKRSDQTLRTITCRTGVTSHNHSQNPDPNRSQRDIDNGLVTVFDLQANGYRCIPLDSIIEITVDGHTFTKSND